MRINNMDHSQCVRRIAEIERELTSLASFATLKPAEQQRFDELRDEVHKVNTQRVRLEFASDVTRGRAEGVKIASGTPDYGQADDDSRPLNGLRDRAMRVIERCVAADTLPARGAEAIERLMGVGHNSERTWAARWAEAAGDPAYLTAWAKKVADPEGARDTFSAAEIEAVRRVHTVAGERAMSQSDSAGGWLIPAQLDPSILLASNGTQSALRQIARVEQTVGETWRGVTSGDATVTFTAEAAEASDGSPTLASPEVPMHKATCFIPFSVELDDAPTFAAEISKVMLDSIENKLNQVYVTGTGSGEPTGFVTALVASSPTVLVNGVGSEVLAASDPVNLQNALPPRWQDNSAWVASLPIYNTLAAFETSGGALRFPSLQNTPPSLLARPAHQVSAMDGTLNAAASETNYVLAVGDWKNFLICDRVGTRTELVPHLFGSNRRPTGQRGFYAWLRTGSDVLVDNAFRLLSIPTTA